MTRPRSCRRRMPARASSTPAASWSRWGPRTLASQPDLPERLADEFKLAIDVAEASSWCRVAPPRSASHASASLPGPPTCQRCRLLHPSVRRSSCAATTRPCPVTDSHPPRCCSRTVTCPTESGVNNARAALAALIDAGAIPIINENDVVATEEMRFSDNDQLAAMVAPLVSADALLLLSDVAGVLDENGGPHPRTRGHERVHRSRQSRQGRPRRHGQQARRGTYGSSFWRSRRDRRWTSPGILTQVLAGEDVGTCIGAVGERLRARQHWIAFTLKPRGDHFGRPRRGPRRRAGCQQSLARGRVLGIRG